MDTEDLKEDIKPFHFHQLGVDSRLLQAIEKLRWKEPTLIQEKTIPLFLKGKDIAVRAKTGSGKTAAYLLAILHRILEIKFVKDFKHTSAVILAPSRDLCKQVTQNIEELTIFCKQEISCVDLSLEHTNMKKKSFKFTNADIIIGTPLNALNWAKNTNSKSKQNIQYVVIDEADLMCTYGYKDDLHKLLTSLSGSAQLFLLSATLSEDVDYLSKKFSRLPVIVRLEEPPLPPEQQLTQYIIKGPVKDKPLLLVVLFRLDLLQGKTLIFVDSIHKGYKLQMFLTMFGVQSRVLNNELPLNLRLHHVDEFNKNVFKILIATDVSSVTNVKKEEDDKINLNSDSSAARGIDFQGLTTVLNYDVPYTTGAYIHRVGRTARAGRRGNALVFVAPQEVERFKRIEEDLRLLNATTDASSSTGIALGNSPFKDFNFDFSSLDGFRYRVMDAWHDCTDQAVKRARAAELKHEILNSKKLKSFLQYNPTDKISLQTLFNKNSPVITKPHLLHIPEYNVPESLRRVAEASKSIKKAKNVTEEATRESNTKKKKKQRGNAWKPKDPLESFDYNPQKK